MKVLAVDFAHKVWALFLVRRDTLQPSGQVISDQHPIEVGPRFHLDKGSVCDDEDLALTPRSGFEIPFNLLRERRITLMSFAVEDVHRIGSVPSLKFVEGCADQALAGLDDEHLLAPFCTIVSDVQKITSFLRQG